MRNKRNSRLLELLAIGMIGEGIIGAIRPRGHLRLWHLGPKGYRNFIKGFVNHPKATRAMCAAEAGLGVWLALRNTR